MYYRMTCCKQCKTPKPITDYTPKSRGICKGCRATNNKKYRKRTGGKVGRPKHKENYYWTQETEQAVIQFQQATTQAERDSIYNNVLRSPVLKIIECLYNKYKFDYVEKAYGYVTASQMVESHLISYTLPFIEMNKGRAFSYLSVSTKNYLVTLNNNLYKELIRTESMEPKEDFDGPEKVIKELSYEDYKDFNLKEFMNLTANYFEANKETICFKQVSYNGHCSKTINKRNNTILNTIIKYMRNCDIDFAFPTENCRTTTSGHNRVTSTLSRDANATVNHIRKFIQKRLMPYYQKALKDYIAYGEIKMLSPNSVSCVSPENDGKHNNK